jgi:hypothetical protein
MEKRRNFPFNLVALAAFQSEGRRLDAVRDIEDDDQRRFLGSNNGPARFPSQHAVGSRRSAFPARSL